MRSPFTWSIFIDPLTPRWLIRVWKLPVIRVDTDSIHLLIFLSLSIIVSSSLVRNWLEQSNSNSKVLYLLMADLRLCSIAWALPILSRNIQNMICHCYAHFVLITTPSLSKNTVKSTHSFSWSFSVFSICFISDAISFAVLLVSIRTWCSPSAWDIAS